MLELEKGKTTKLREKYCKLSITEALAVYMKRYIRDTEAWKMNRMFTTDPSKLYSQ